MEPEKRIEYLERLLELARAERDMAYKTIFRQAEELTRLKKTTEGA